MTRSHDQHPDNKDTSSRTPQRSAPAAGSPDLARLSLADAAGLQHLAGNRAVSALIAQRRMAPPAPATAEEVTPDDIGAVTRGPGKPLPDGIRRRAENATGTPMSHVRMHTGPAAEASAAALQARAYTVGSDIVVGKGGADEETVLHETKHIDQQARGAVAGRTTAGGTQLSSPNDVHEREATAFAAEEKRNPTREPAAAPEHHHPGEGHDHGAVQRATAVQRVAEGEGSAEASAARGSSLDMRDHNNVELYARDSAQQIAYVQNLAQTGRADIYRLLLDRLRKQGQNEQARVLAEQWEAAQGQATGQLVAVPRQLHFVWFGPEIPEFAVKNLQAWQSNAEGTGWTLHIWTDANASGWQQNLGPVFGDQLTIHTVDAAFVRENAGAEVMNLYLQAKEGGAFNMMSDILRYVVLLQEGGVYMDVDIAEGGVRLRDVPEVRMHLESLPLLAPLLRDQKSVNEALGRKGKEPEGSAQGDQDLAAAATARYASGKFNNNMIAAPPGAAFIRELLDNLPANFKDLASKYTEEVLVEQLKGVAPDISGPNFVEKTLRAYTQEHMNLGTTPLGVALAPREYQHLLEPTALEFWKALEWVTSMSEDQLDREPGKKPSRARSVFKKVEDVLRRNRKK